MGVVEAEEADVVEDGSEKPQCALAADHDTVYALGGEADLGDAADTGRCRAGQGVGGPTGQRRRESPPARGERRHRRRARGEATDRWVAQVRCRGPAVGGWGCWWSIGAGGMEDGGR